MKNDERVMNAHETGEERCDIKIWSGACGKSDATNPGEKYLCAICGEIPNLDHEMRHDTFPYIVGDKDFLS